MTLGDIIKKYRKDNKLSLRQFSIKSGISHSYINNIENNKSPNSDKTIAPTIDTIKKVSKAIKIPFDDLIKMIEDNQLVTINFKKNNDKLDRLLKKNKSEQIIDLLSNMSDEEIEKVIKIIDIAKED